MTNAVLSNTAQSAFIGMLQGVNIGKQLVNLILKLVYF